MGYAVIGFVVGAATGIFITLGLVIGPTSQVPPRPPAPRKQEDKFRTFLRPKTWGIR